jgi:flagellar biosynthesis/type III secretory pathway M-ring protein FliF/YscJ
MEAIRHLEALWFYSLRCAQAPAYLPACDSFWNWVAGAAIVAGVLIALYILRNMVKHFLAVRAEAMRIAGTRRVADEDTLAEYKADTDKLLDVSPQEDVRGRIRQALDERRLGDQRRRPDTGRKQEGPG